MYTAKCGNNVSIMLVVVDDNFHADIRIDRLEDPTERFGAGALVRILRVRQVERLLLPSTHRLEVEADVGGIVVDARPEGPAAVGTEARGLDRKDLVRPVADGRHVLGVLGVEAEVGGGVDDREDDVVHIVNIHLI